MKLSNLHGGDLFPLHLSAVEYLPQCGCRNGSLKVLNGRCTQEKLLKQNKYQRVIH